MTPEECYELYENFVQTLDGKEKLNILQKFVNFCESLKLDYSQTIVTSYILFNELQGFSNYIADKKGLYS